MFRSSWCLIVCLCLLSPPNLALAQTERSSPLIDGIRKTFDKNQDGRLDADELQQMREALQRKEQRSEAPRPLPPGKINLQRTPLYKAQPGPLKYGALETLTLRDESRKKSLEVRVTFPQTGGPYPVLVFSHGLLGSKDAYHPLVEHWASHGYVILQPTHGDSLQALQPGSRMTLAGLFAEWNQRPLDVQLILNQLEQIEQDHPELQGKLDRKLIGLGGHSFGAQTTELLSGVELKGPLGQRSVSYREPRAKSALWISPTGAGPGYRDGSFDNVQIPVLAITGSKDDSPVGGQTWQQRIPAFDLLPPGDKYMLFIDGGYHGFGGIAGAARYAGSGPQDTDHLLAVLTATTAFWDATLKADASQAENAAKKFLQSDELLQASQQAARIFVRQIASDKFTPPAD